MPAWRDLADRLDRLVVETFDHGDVRLQKMLNGVPSGPSIALPAEFDGAFQSIRVADGVEATTVGPVVTIHYGHLPAGTFVELDDRILIDAGPAAGTYVVTDLQPNGDHTGAVVHLRKATLP